MGTLKKNPSLKERRGGPWFERSEVNTKGWFPKHKGLSWLISTWEKILLQRRV